MSADRFLTTVAGDLGEGMLRHEDGEVRGRARVTSDASSGVEVAVLEGFSAVTGSGAAIRVEFEPSDDWKWAIDLWRSLRPADRAVTRELARTARTMGGHATDRRSTRLRRHRPRRLPRL